MGGLYYATYSGSLEPFDLNGELKHGFYVPAIFSAGLLFAAGWSALGLGRARVTPAWAWLGIAGFFAFLGVDELATIHEQLETWTGVDWQLLYAPVAALGAALWLRLFAAFSTSALARAMWVCGACAWLIAQVIEHFEFNSQGDAVGLAAELILAEEVCEMIGSSLVLLAILIIANRAAGASSRP